jgi:CBS domain-containing protein
VVTAGPDTDVGQLARLMLANHVGAIPVVDNEAHVLGIVSDHDLLRHPPSDSPRAWWLHLFDADAVCLEDIATARDLKARDVMERRVTTVLGTAPIGVIGSLMRRRKLKHVPVVRDGKLVGIVSRGDLLDALVRQSEQASGSSPAA